MVYDLQRGYQTTVINSAEHRTLLHQVVVNPNARYNNYYIIIQIRTMIIILIHFYIGPSIGVT